MLSNYFDHSISSRWFYGSMRIFNVLIVVLQILNGGKINKLTITGDDFADGENVKTTFALKFQDEEIGRCFLGAHAMGRKQNAEVSAADVTLDSDASDAIEAYKSSEYYPGGEGATPLKKSPSPEKAAGTPRSPEKAAETPSVDSKLSFGGSGGFGAASSTPGASSKLSFGGASTFTTTKTDSKLSFGGASAFGASTAFGSSALKPSTATFGSAGGTMSFGTGAAKASSSFSAAATSNFGSSKVASTPAATTSVLGAGATAAKGEDDDIEADEVDVNKLKLPDFEGMDKKIEVVRGDEEEEEMIKV